VKTVTLFNNREIATAIWAAVFLGWAVTQKSVRQSMWGVVKAFVHPKMLMPVGLMSLYTSGMIIALKYVGLWSPDQVKDTIMWFCFTGVALGFSFVSFGSTDNVFRKIVVDNVKIILLLEFLIGTYTFSLVGELIMIPALASVGMLDVVAKSDEKYAVVAKVTGALNSMAGLAIVVFAVVQAVGHYKDFQSLDTLRSFLLPPVLTILFAPCTYIMALVSRYELLFIRLEIGPKKPVALKRYAKRRMILHCQLSLRKVTLLLNTRPADLMHIRTREDLLKIFAQQNSRVESS
jgi:hypothetical protein